jgi:tetratricopeptide (TPR) repeat protein
MKSFLLCVLGLIAASTTLPAQQVKQKAADHELRGRCHAHFFFTAALAEEDDKRRLALLTQAIEQDPKLARAFYNRGNIYARQDKLALAQADFQKAAELKDDYIHAHYNLACILSLESRSDDALASLEQALAKGYQKFDQIPTDSDFKGLTDKAAFARVIAKYRASNDPKRLSAVQKMQTSTAEQRATLLDDSIRNPGPHAMPLALWALQEPDYELRVLAVALLRKLDRPESKSALVCGLYDANGYVNKAAANALLSYGKDVEGLMTWVLEDTWVLKDKDTHAAFYAMQVLAKTKSASAAVKIVPFLRDENPQTRIMAAESLAALEAVAALPAIEAALKNPPKDEREQGFYKAAIGRAIEHLRKVKKSGDK